MLVQFVINATFIIKCWVDYLHRLTFENKSCYVRPGPHQTDKRETHCFATNLQQFRNIYETFLQLLCFLQLYRVQFQVDKDQKVSDLFHISLPADWSQRSVTTLRKKCGGHGFTNSKWSMEETRNFIFFVN